MRYKEKDSSVARWGVRAAMGSVGTVAVLGLFYQYVFGRDPGPLKLVMRGKTHHRDFYDYRDAAGERFRRESHYIPLEQYSSRGELLRGFYYPWGERPCKRIAFLLHGYRSDHAECAGMLWEFYKSRGFDVFCCDNRASGLSEGRIIGYDVYESEDCLRWLELLRRRFGGDIEIILHGFSMGGAAALKASDRVPDNVKFIVSDSGFSGILPILKPRLGPLLWPLRLMNRALAGYDLSESDVRPNLGGAKTPILFVHGQEDRTVPVSMGRQLYQLCPTDKDCLFVAGARHVESFYCAEGEYSQKLDQFITRYIRSCAD